MMELDNCPCSGANLPRFVQPVILAVLSSGPLHGYLVVQRLAETSLFRKQPPDATGVYRMLRNMEQEGVLESDWELENSGPARKRYTLTEKGGHCLDQWMRTLTSHQAFIANLLLFLQDARSGMNSETCPMP
ncbi:MAG: PadR family transcriptional regulator, partial [Bilophila wadsworthia]